MIKTFNRQQVLYGFLRGLFSLILFILTYLFFHAVVTFVVNGFHLDISSLVVILISLGCVLCVLFSGYRRWKNGADEFAVGESFISNQLDPDSGGAWGTQNYVNRITGPAFYLTAIFLAAPDQLFKAWDHFQSTIPLDDALEQRMLDLLDRLKQINKWQNFNTHQGVERELIFLIKMGQVQYSPQKGRIKAR